MWLLLRLAVKNLMRNRRRTILTTISVVAGTGILIVGQGFIGGLDENIIASAIQGTVGHAMARPAHYPIEGNQHPLDDLLNITPAARALLEKDAVAWTERTYFSPLAASHADSLRITAIGYDPARDSTVFPRTHWNLEGKDPVVDGDEIAISPGVARLLSLKPGDRMILQVRTHLGAINALDVSVASVLTTHNAALDLLVIWVPQALARRLIAADLPTHLSVKLDRRDASEPFAVQLRQALGDKAEVVTWQDEVVELLQIQNIRRRSLDILVFILLALAAFGIANTILMAAHERVREVGTLRSLGMTESDVVRLFLFEGAMMGFTGGLAGATWGGWLVNWWSIHPIDFSKALERQGGSISVSSYVYTQLNPATIGSAILLGVVVAVVASIYPARVASRMAPADAVRAT